MKLTTSYVKLLSWRRIVDITGISPSVCKGMSICPYVHILNIPVLRGPLTIDMPLPIF